MRIRILTEGALRRRPSRLPFSILRRSKTKFMIGGNQER
jgi:hypothetical protein